jgi:hypothetical protein
VQRGTMHRWRNVSDEKPARMLAVLMANERAFVGGRELKQEMSWDVVRKVAGVPMLEHTITSNIQVHFICSVRLQVHLQFITIEVP